MPVIPFSLLRAVHIQWQDSFVFHIAMAPALLLLAKFRTQIAFNTKVFILLFMSLFIAAVGYTNFSISSNAASYLLLGIFLSLIFGSRKTAFYYSALAVIIICIFAFLTINDIVQPEADLADYHKHPSTWGNNLVTFTLVFGMVFMIAGELVKKLDDLTNELTEKNKALKDASSEIEEFRKLIPICGYCYSNREDNGDWDKLESYFKRHTNSRFSHGICPTCLGETTRDRRL